MITDEITIRSIQHYMYCPHRWGLMEIGRSWAENYFVTKANLMHDRVHDPDNHYTLRGRKVFTSVPVYNDIEEYNLYGVTDCIECYKSEDGIYINEGEEKYNICIVEYKPRKPKDKEFRKEDLMQVFAQKICVDYVFHCDSEAVLYYSDVKKRYRLPVLELYDELDGELKSILEEMRSNMKNGYIPQIRKGQNCNGCSMKDLCMPSIKTTKSFRNELKKLREIKLSE